MRRTFRIALASAALGGLIIAAGAPAAEQKSAPAAAANPAPTGDMVVAQAKISPANQFNRLLKKKVGNSHPPPWEDGSHDPQNPGTKLLQPPEEAFASLPKARGGNGVDRVKALEQGLIRPWYDLEDPEAEPFVLDLVIVRQVRGSMPNVVYPHLQHTQWLDCTNCHDEIFIPEKGANQISMAEILLGKKCGVCRGKIAFPVTDCRRCHAQPKTPEELRKLAEGSNWAN